MKPLACGVLALVLVLAGSNAFAESPAGGLVDQPAPTFRLPDVVGGEEVSLQDLRGRIIVLHFAASW